VYNQTKITLLPLPNTVYIAVMNDHIPSTPSGVNKAKINVKKTKAKMRFSNPKTMGLWMARIGQGQGMI